MNMQSNKQLKHRGGLQPLSNCFDCKHSTRKNDKAGEVVCTLHLIEHFPNDENTEFRISSKMEMQLILQSLMDKGTCIALFYGRDQHFIQATLLDVNEHGMWLDIGPLPAENKPLLLDGKITFVSVSQRIKIQFAGRNIETDLFDNNEAFYLKLPDYLLRIQRRDFFRTPIPAATIIKCIVPVHPENPDAPAVMRSIPIVDISGGGIGLLCDGDEATLLPYKTFPDCQISIPDVGTLTVFIEVRNSISFITHGKVAHKRVGCRFIQLDNRMNNLLQLYIARLQSVRMVRL